MIRAAALLGLLGLLACDSAPRGEPVLVTIPRGASPREVADTLVARDVIGHAPLFRAYVRLRRADRTLKAGIYRLAPGERWSEVVDVLSQGRVATLPMTIPEGWRLAQMVPRIAEMTNLPPDSVNARLSGDSLHVRWRVPGPGLEGYLFPDTYRFTPGSSLDAVVRAMTDRYRRYWTRDRRTRLETADLSEQEAVTLASIVQAEARRVEEMPIIAAVYLNRIERGYPLQADPTVLYALGGPRQRLLYAAIDSVADDPYNTYARTGLPPGPIGAPGEAALDAVLAPKDVDYLYFVARPDGSHVFTRTLSEHNRAKALARRAWDSIDTGMLPRPPFDQPAVGPSGG